MRFLREFYSRITKEARQLFGSRSSYWFRTETTQVSEDTSMEVSAFNRGVIYISTQIAKLPWDLKDADNTIIRNPISNLLDLAPNPEMNAFRWRLMMVQQAIIHGNSYAEIERNKIGTAIALWPLKSRMMELLRTERGELVYRYSNPDGSQVFLNPRDVYHLPNFHTKDGLVGQGVVGYAREVLGIQIAADRMASGIFHNSGIPSGVLKHPGRLSPEAYKRLKESWDSQHGGRKTGGTSILEEGTLYEALNMDPESLQFIQSREFGILEIARFLGIPPTKLFDNRAATYNNVENANLEVATDTLDSWAKNLEIEADVKILNYRFGGKFTQIDLYSVFRGDMKSRSDYFKSMMGIGALTPNQIREMEGLPPYKDGNSYYIQTNNLTPTDRVHELIDADIKNKEKPNAPANSNPSPKPNEDNNQLTSAVVKFLNK